MKTNRKIHGPPLVSDRLPSLIYFRNDFYEADSACPLHRHSWGELNFAFSGAMELRIAGERYLSPAQIAIWTPPGVPHDGYNRFATRYCSIYVAKEFCGLFPSRPCMLTLSPLVKSIAEDFAGRNITFPESDEDLRLARVLIDQLHLAPRQELYLPLTHHPRLKRLMEELQKNPGDQRSLAEWGEFLAVTERTLARDFQSALGMTFAEWRRRLRLITAVARLKDGHSVQDVALDLGYSSSSAFIAMFQRMKGTTPAQLGSKGAHFEK